MLESTSPVEKPSEETISMAMHHCSSYLPVRKGNAGEDEEATWKHRDSALPLGDGKIADKSFPF